MPILLCAFFGAAICGVSFFKLTFQGQTILTLLIILTCAYYLVSLVRIRKGSVAYGKFTYSDKALMCFTFWGVFVVLLSYLGFCESTFDLQVFFDYSYIPRQAYYLFFIPLIVLAGRDLKSKKWIDWICRNSKRLFIAIYVLYILVNRTFSLSVPCVFCLGLLLLLKSSSNKVLDTLLLALIIFSPIAVGSEMTQIIVRVLIAIFYFRSADKVTFKVFGCAMIIIILACFLVTSLPMDSFGFDANTVWRAQYWCDEINQLGKTFGLGVGYGTSYATQGFAGQAITGPFVTADGFTAAERLFIVGCHNSFVSISFRLGVIGLILILVFFGSLINECETIQSRNFGAAGFSVIAAMVIVCFNVGFESPAYFFLFAFSVVVFHELSNNAIAQKGSSDKDVPRKGSCHYSAENAKFSKEE